MDRIIFLQVLLSGVIHALWNFAAKKSSGNLAVNWLAQFVGAFVLLPFAMAENGFVQISSLGFKCVIAAGVIQSFYFWLLSASYRTGEISVVYPVARGLGIAGSAAVGIFFFGDLVSTIGSVGIVTISSGTLIIGIGQMRQRGANLVPLFFAAAVALSLVFSAYVDKAGVAVAPAATYLCLVYVVSSLFSAPLFLLRYREGVSIAIKSQKRLVGVVGTGAAFSYLIILFAMRTGPLGYILAVREIAVVGGAVLGVSFLQEEVTKSKVLGIIAIVFGIVLIKLS